MHTMCMVAQFFCAALCSKLFVLSEALCGLFRSGQAPRLPQLELRMSELKTRSQASTPVSRQNAFSCWRRGCAILSAALVGSLAMLNPQGAAASEPIIPPEQSWHLNDYLSCDFRNRVLLQSAAPGDSPHDVWEQYVALLNERCSGQAGALYTVTFAADQCTPTIVVGSNGANPRALAGR